MILRKGSAVAVIVRSGPGRPAPAAVVRLVENERTHMVLRRIADVMPVGRGSPTQIPNDMNVSFKSEEISATGKVLFDGVDVTRMEIGLGVPYPLRGLRYTLGIVR